MAPFTRAWLAAALLLLVGAALLHSAMAIGLTAVWPALIHLTLFGWIGGMIVAVNYHTMPVFTRRDFPAPKLIWLHLGAQLAGLALATAGLLGAGRGLVAAGLALELVASLLFLLNIALLIARGPRRNLPPMPLPVPTQGPVDRVGTAATTAAGLCLPAALGLLLAARTGALGGSWWLAAEHLAALGWVMLMIAGVAYHVLPRFSGRGTRGVAWVRAQLGLHLPALGLIVAGLGLGQGGVFAAGGVTMSLALALFGYSVWPTLRAVGAGPQLVVPTVKGGAR